MEVALNKSQRLVVNAAEKAGCRPVLHCIHIRKGVVEAANGFILVQKKVEYDGDEKLLLDIADVAKLKDSVDRQATIITEGDTVKAETGEFKSVAGNFPNVDVLFPTQVPFFKIALSCEQLSAILKSLSKDEEVIRFYFYSPIETVKFEVESTGTRGLIMPMCVQW